RANLGVDRVRRVLLLGLGETVGERLRLWAVGPDAGDADRHVAQAEDPAVAGVVGHAVEELEEVSEELLRLGPVENVVAERERREEPFGNWSRVAAPLV